MKIPDTVSFMSSRYEVRKTPGFHKNVNKDNFNRDQGRVDYNNAIIDIDPELSHHKQTFFHEVQHIIAYHMGVELEEADVDRLAEGWLHFLETNHMLAEER